MIVEAGLDLAVTQWLASLGIRFTPPFVTLAIRDRGNIIAAAVFNDYQGTNINMSVVFARRIALTRGNLRALFTYPFVTLGVNRLSVRTSATNMPVRKQIRRLGFRPEGKHPQYYGSTAAISYGMLRADCKWLR
jgi:RimJ/RimL family protein N-acetyltransferase